MHGRYKFRLEIRRKTRMLWRKMSRWTSDVDAAHMNLQHAISIIFIDSITQLANVNSMLVNPLKFNSSICYTLPYRPNLSFLPERDYVTFGSLLSQIRLSSVCLSSVGNVRAPYSGGWTFRQYFFTATCILVSLWPPCKVLERSSHGNPFIGGVKRKRGSKIQRFCTCRRLYLTNGTRYGLGYS